MRRLLGYLLVLLVAVGPIVGCKEEPSTSIQDGSKVINDRQEGSRPKGGAGRRAGKD